MELSVFVLYVIQTCAYFSFATVRTQYAGPAKTLHSIIILQGIGFDKNVLNY
jgi:hypothetical protein